MSRQGSYSGERRKPRNVLVARTLVVPQSELGEFLDSAGKQLYRQLGRRVVVSALGSLHVTLLESAGPIPAFRQKRFTKRDVRMFYAELQQCLADIEGTSDNRVVRIDPNHPLKWFGRERRSLGLQLASSDALLAERRHIEEFLRERFGDLPPMNPFHGHVTFANFAASAIGAEAQRHPTALLREGMVIPEELALNGLVVFLNGIGDSPAGAE